MFVFFYLMIMSFTYLTVHSEMEAKCDCSELAVIKEMMQQILFENRMESTRLKILEAKQKTASHKSLSPVSSVRLENLEQKVGNLEMKFDETKTASSEEQKNVCSRNIGTVVNKMLMAEKKARKNLVSSMDKQIMEHKSNIEAFKIKINNTIDEQFKLINASQTKQAHYLKEKLAVIENMDVNYILNNISAFQEDIIVEVNRRFDGIQPVNKCSENVTTKLMTVNDSINEVKQMITSLDKLVKEEKVWSPWSLWGDCSEKQCYSYGVKERNRKCASQFGCIGNSKDFSICNGDCNVRLVNGSSDLEGRLEVFHDGEWGTVCDDDFDNTDASVVCKMLLPFSDVKKVYKEAHFGRGSLPILLDGVNCKGSERSLFLCPHNGWGNHDCSHGEDVGIACGPIFSKELKWHINLGLV